MHVIVMRGFRINEDDLCELERILPQLCDFATMRPDALPLHRKQTRVLQRILCDVRWNYGPPEQVIEIPAGDSDEPKA